jgi:hypothetical protein
MYTVETTRYSALTNTSYTHRQYFRWLWMARYVAFANNHCPGIPCESKVLTDIQGEITK